MGHDIRQRTTKKKNFNETHDVPPMDQIKNVTSVSL